MVLDFMYIIFFFFTHKQIYVTSHFTGRSRKVNLLIAVVSLLNLVFEVIYIIYISVKNSLIHAVIILLIAFGLLFLINKLICKLGMLQSQKELNINDPLFFPYYNYKLDVYATITALIGIVINTLLIIIFLINIISKGF